MKPWTGYTVVVHLHKTLLDRMMEETYPGVKTSDSSYIGRHKKLSSRWYREQTETLWDEWKETAASWNVDTPPPEVQQK